MSMAAIPAGATVIFVDGECIFCNRMVSFILKHDPSGHFYFSHLQAAAAEEVLARYGRAATDVDSVYVLAGVGTPDERLLWEGRAVRELAPRLFWFGFALLWVPLPLLDVCYRA